MDEDVFTTEEYLHFKECLKSLNKNSFVLIRPDVLNNEHRTKRNQLVSVDYIEYCGDEITGIIGSLAYNGSFIMLRPWQILCIASLEDMEAWVNLYGTINSLECYKKNYYYPDFNLFFNINEAIEDTTHLEVFKTLDTEKFE